MSSSEMSQSKQPPDGFLHHQVHRCGGLGGALLEECGPFLACSWPWLLTQDLGGQGLGLLCFWRQVVLGEPETERCREFAPLPEGGQSLCVHWPPGSPALRRTPTSRVLRVPSPCSLRCALLLPWPSSPRPGTCPHLLAGLQLPPGFDSKGSPSRRAPSLPPRQAGPSSAPAEPTRL